MHVCHMFACSFLVFTGLCELQINSWQVPSQLVRPLYYIAVMLLCVLYQRCHMQLVCWCAWAADSCSNVQSCRSRCCRRMCRLLWQLLLSASGEGLLV